MTLSIIIVNYNVKHFLLQCLQSIEKASNNIKLEIIVVDNNSIDDSVEVLKKKFPYVNIIVNKKNLGFSKANNQAIKIAQGKYILLLNPDTVIQENTLESTINFLNNNKQVGALGVKMIDGNGVFLPESKRSLPRPSTAFYKIFGLSKLFPKSKKFGQYHLNYIDKNKISEIDVISGAFFMVRKKVLDKIGLLDEQFFMYGEDIDLSYRIQKSGYKNFYFPNTSIIHYKGESTKKTSVNYIFIFYKAMILFVKKHYSKKNATPLIIIMNIAIFMRAFISIIKRITLQITQPIIDTITILIGMYMLQLVWAQNYFLDKNYYTDTLLNYIIPIYVLCWILGIYSQNGYNKPLKVKNSIKGLIAGSLFMLIAYALLPENLRFSRALILLGAIYSIISITSIRYLLHYSNFYIFKIEDYQSRRIGIIAEQKEFQRIYKIIKNANPKIKYIQQINKFHRNNQSVGNINQLPEILAINNLNEIVFSAQDFNVHEIINYMSNINSSIKIKIAPSESTFVIGSHSIHNTGNLYELNNQDNKPHMIKVFFKKILSFFN